MLITEGERSVPRAFQITLQTWRKREGEDRRLNSFTSIDVTSRGARKTRSRETAAKLWALASRRKSQRFHRAGRLARARGRLVKFWRTSAIVPLCVSEPRSSTVRAILVKDLSMAFRWAMRTECVSAPMRAVREGGLGAGVNGKQDRLSRNWWTHGRRFSRARPFVKTRSRCWPFTPLGPAAASELAAALMWRQGGPAGVLSVSFDARSRDTAHEEGFAPLPSTL